MTTSLPLPNPDRDPIVGDSLPSAEEIVQLLKGYKAEAVDARKGGPSPRDDVWEANVNLYWNRFDFSRKADWQSKEVMPEAAMFVDRWAAAMRKALTRVGQWYDIIIEGDDDGDLARIVRKFMNVWLSRCGRTASGHPMDFSAVFEEQMKLGAMMASCASVTWKERDGRGYVAVEAVDPRSVWFDATGRGLYRIRTTTIDHHDLVRMAGKKDDEGRPLYNIEQIEMLTATVAQQMRTEQEALAGHGKATTSTRKEIVLDEYLATLVDIEGNVLAENALFIVANDQWLIRGPEKNPFWHGRDWIIYAGLINVPLSVYDRSYMENWSSVARAFIEMTNLIIDGTFTSAMNAFAGVPDMLEDPSELAEGISPNKFFNLIEGSDPKMFMREIDLGSMPPEVIAVWQGLKAELREGALQSEISLGQIPPKGDITATEINQSSQGGAEFQASIARTVEIKFLEPTLEEIWTTALQHMRQDDEELRRAVGSEGFDMLFNMRETFARSHITFRVEGISALVARLQELQGWMQFLQIVGQNETLAAALMQKLGGDLGGLVDHLLTLLGLDISKIQAGPRERQIAAAQQGGQQGQDPAAQAAGQRAQVETQAAQASAQNRGAIEKEKLTQAQIATQSKEGLARIQIAKALEQLKQARSGGAASQS